MDKQVKHFRINHKEISIKWFFATHMMTYETQVSHQFKPFLKSNIFLTQYNPSRQILKVVFLELNYYFSVSIENFVWTVK